MSTGALIAIQEKKLSIPADIGIICFDDSDWKAIFKPPITVVKQPVYQLGATACELLINKIDNEQNDISNDVNVITLNTELVIRNSTKKCLVI